MIDLGLGIFFFTLLLIFFKLFEKYKVENLTAILVNYIVASGLGFYFSESDSIITDLPQRTWFLIALLIGLIFILVFNLLASASQKVGIAIATVANKMSMIIPVIFASLLFGDEMSYLKIIGICLALLGVYLTTTQKGKLSFDQKYLWLIIIIFLGQGLADVLFNYAQHELVGSAESEIFIASLFGAAFITGLVMGIPGYLKGSKKVNLKSILWGVGLGIPNYLTIFFFFRALESGILESSQCYPVLNMGVIVMSALSGLLLFKERLSTMNWIGILVSASAIFFVIIA